MDWLAHPLVVATYVTLLGLLIAAVKGVASLFNRVGKVEDGIDRLEASVGSLSDDLRAHMADEGKNIAHLEALIRSVRDKE